MGDLAALLEAEIDEAAARLDGDVFADAYGRSVVGRVRRRRAVRAGVGAGASVAAVGAFALAAPSMSGPGPQAVPAAPTVGAAASGQAAPSSGQSVPASEPPATSIQLPDGSGTLQTQGGGIVVYDSSANTMRLEIDSSVLAGSAGPFQCGFQVYEPVHASDGLEFGEPETITRNQARDIMSAAYGPWDGSLPNNGENLLALTLRSSGTLATGGVDVSGVTVMGFDPATSSAIWYAGVNDVAELRSISLVAVADGVVVATWEPGGDPGSGPVVWAATVRTTSPDGGVETTETLLADPNARLQACGSAGAAAADADIYVVAGVRIDGPGQGNPPQVTYAWRPLV